MSEECEVVVSSLVLLRGPSSSSSQVIRKDSILVIFQKFAIISGTEWKFPFFKHFVDFDGFPFNGLVH